MYLNMKYTNGVEYVKKLKVLQKISYIFFFNSKQTFDTTI